MDGRYRDQVRAGQQVRIVRKQDQRSGSLTSGVVARLLTRSRFHPHGIKVELESGHVGRIRHICAAAEDAVDEPH